ncbi:MAG: response regulator [Leptolyngbyaceae cyanobacterium bins.302]|nr:response regulator [Leptolyngbyaceae cyanobacterium bins.302]
MTVQKLVLIVQPVRLQALIWQAVLKSQRIAVILESPETDLAENLDQLKTAGLVLPDLLILDMQSPSFNHYAFCRWCREQYANTKVVLTNSGQSTISLSERQWAVNQGASDLLPGFQRENLVSGVAIAVKRILEILDDHPLNNGALISVLLSVKRELDIRASGVARSAMQQRYTSRLGQSAGVPQPETAVLELANLKTAVVQQSGLKNGKPSGNGVTPVGKMTKGNGISGHGPNGASKTANGATAHPATIAPVADLISESKPPLDSITSTTAAPNGQSSDDSAQGTSSSKESDIVLHSDPELADPAHTTQPMRRYRGLYY